MDFNLSNDRAGELFRVMFKVRPSGKHPRYFAMGHGRLVFMVLDSSVESAAERAAHVAEVLPFEIVGPPTAGKCIRLYSDSPHQDPTTQALAYAEAQANEIGLFYLFIGAEAETPEGDFFAGLEEGEEWKT